MPADNARLRLPAQRRLPPGDQTNHSRTVTIRAGQKPTRSYGQRWCAEDNAAVQAARDRLTFVSHRPERKALFFRGPGGFLCASSKESLPGYRLPIAIGKSPGGKPPKPPTRSPALSAAIRRRSLALSAAIRRPGGTSSYIPRLLAGRRSVGGTTSGRDIKLQC